MECFCVLCHGETEDKFIVVLVGLCWTLDDWRATQKRALCPCFRTPWETPGRKAADGLWTLRNTVHCYPLLAARDNAAGLGVFMLCRLADHTLRQKQTSYSKTTAQIPFATQVFSLKNQMLETPLGLRETPMPWLWHQQEQCFVGTPSKSGTQWL